MSVSFSNMIFKRLLDILPGGLKILKQQMRILARLKTEHHYRNFSIRLPAEHLLPPFSIDAPNLR